MIIIPVNYLLLTTLNIVFLKKYYTNYSILNNPKNPDM